MSTGGFGKVLLDRLLDAISLPVAVIAPDHTVLFMNRAASAAARPGEKCFELLAGLAHPCSEEGFECPVLEAISRGRVVESVRELDLGEGRRTFEVLACPIIGDDGGVTAVVEIIRDVTDSMLLRKFKELRDGGRVLFEAVPDAIITIDSQGRVVAANPAVAEIFGVSPEELRRKGLEMILPAGLHGRHDDFVAAAAARGRIKEGNRRVEVNGVHRERGEIPVELSLSAWRRGDEIMFTAVIRDISSRRALEEENRLRHAALNEDFSRLERIKKEWQLVLDSVPDPVLMAGSGDEIIRCNRSLVKLLGLDYARVLGRQWKELLSENGVEEGDFWGDRLIMVHARSGRAFAVQVNAARGEKDLVGSVVVLQEVSAEIAMTEEIEANRRALRSALDGIGETIVRVAEESDFSLRVATGVRGNCWEVMACGRQDCPSYGDEGGRCWERVGTFCGGEVQGAFARKLGNCRKCRFYLSQHEDPLAVIGEQFNHMMTILEEKNSELMVAYEKLKQAQGQLLQQEKMASIGQLAAGVAHEINNPVGFVSSNLSSMSRYGEKIREYIATLEEKVGDDPESAALKKKLKVGFILEDLTDLVRESLDGTDRVRDIVMNLKIFSRIDQSSEKPADINECIESTLKIVWNELKYKAKVEKDLAELPLTLCQAQQMNQVFMNLLVNAGQAISDKGVIRIKSWSEEGMVCVSISDTGSGIPADKIEHIFEPFFTTKDVGKGTGLGLSIVYDIVTNKHNGTIAVKSEEGVGTTFTVKIPLVEEGGGKR